MSSKEEFSFFLKKAKAELRTLESEKKSAEIKYHAAKALFKEANEASVKAFQSLIISFPYKNIIIDDTISQIESSFNASISNEVPKIYYELPSGTKISVIPREIHESLIEGLRINYNSVKSLLEETRGFITEEHKKISDEYYSSAKRSQEATELTLKILKREINITKRIELLEYVIEHGEINTKEIVKKIINMTDVDEYSDENKKESNKVLEFARENSEDIPKFVMEYIEAWAKE